eukprot:scaffold97932_cov77-Phaeocystis_antarctica.AAC.1
MAVLLRLLRLLVLAPDALLQSFFNLADDLLSAWWRSVRSALSHGMPRVCGISLCDLEQRDRVQ